MSTRPESSGGGGEEGHDRTNSTDTGTPEKSTSSSTKGRHRFKPQLSCTLCRGRKLKCDRNQPCNNCVKRDLASTCTFLHAGIIREKASVQKTNTAVNPKDVHGRIKHLEDLVVSLMQRSTTSSDIASMTKPETTPEPESHYSPQSISDTSESLGRFSIDDDRPNYTGGSHWAAILDSIAGLKDSVEYTEWSQEDEKQWKGPPQVTGPALLVGSVRKASRSDILASMPQRPVVDHLIDTLFKWGVITSCAVHEPSFRKQYEEFWASPQTYSIMWIGLLFSLLACSASMPLLTGVPNPTLLSGMALQSPQAVTEHFKEKTVQCLVLGNYTNPTQFTVETLLVYTLLENFSSPDAQIGTWMCTGLLVRAAMRLGYHRDASHYPAISILQGEIQRRIWAIVCHVDLASSSAVGLPRMVMEDSFDTRYPSNLLDGDVDENTKVLPPGRPMTDVTPIGYLLLKHDMSLVLGKIVDQSNSTESIAYEDVLRLDELLQEARHRVPDNLIVRNREDLKSGSAELRMRKFSTDLIYQKSRCILHRKFLTPSRSSSESPYPFSTKSCVDSAMAILHSHAILWDDTQPGRPLFEHKWQTTTLITHDFLLAAMLVCLYLSQTTVDTFLSAAENPNEFSITWTRDQMLEALESSFKIWNSIKCGSKEAMKAANALKAMITRIKGSGTPASIGRTPPQNPELSTNLMQVNQLPQLTPESSISSSSPWISGSLNSAQYPPPGMDVSQSSYHVVDNMMDAPMDLNWELWDNHFQPIGVADAVPETWNINNSFVTFPDPNTTGMDYFS